MKFNGKILKTVRNSGTLFSFQVVRNLRVNGKPTNHVLKGMGSLHESKINDGAARLGFWLNVTDKLNELLKEGKITHADAETIKSKFAAVVPPINRKSSPRPALEKAEFDRLAERYVALKS
jgi:hypothetical protein